ncbi:MAG: acetate--CoA ligase family protein [Sandaracinaceae bacterium]|nr:acetate--CoA ligase family protein [Sandaracinaceae bacterium]
MKDSFLIVCETAEFAVEVARVAAEVGLRVTPAVIERPLATSAQTDGAAGYLLATTPKKDDLLRLRETHDASGNPLCIALVSDAIEAQSALALAGELGMAAVDEVRPFIAALALITAGAKKPWSASTKGLSAVDRARLRFAIDGSEKSSGRLVRADAGLLAWARANADTHTVLGEPRDVAVAIAALEAAELVDVPARRATSTTDAREVLDIIFGPPRALSDPASKAALRPYGLPLPIEELCASPSRAASEATRIGYPVRIALASPDLRVWDHPDLAVDGVDHAARVRDVFHQLMTLAQTREPRARLLGVTVTATTEPAALLRVYATPLGTQRVHVAMGFADAHGTASHDETIVVLPASVPHVERAFSRLVGAELLFAGGATIRRASVIALHDVLERLAAFLLDRQGELDAVELNPVALLMGGAVEVREACVHVGDAFLRSLDAPVLQR